MSYAHHLSQTATHNSNRRILGIAFVVLLHIGAILTISNGLRISNDSKPHFSKVSPLAETEKPKPLIEPVTVIQKSNGKINITAEQPVINLIDPPTDPTGISAKPNTNETKQSETLVVMAKVDPAYPLTQPMYPAASRRAGEEGRVELLIYVLANGKVGEARVAKSSGFNRLDDAAVKEALKAWRFIPQQVNGTNVESWQTIAITFRLKN